MANYANGVNPELLKWAREKAGYTLSDVAKRFKKDESEIISWESGDSVPTYNQLETLAYRLYKRPIALFFFPEPPHEPGPDDTFRTLPDFELQNLSPDSLHAVRQARAMQIALAELSHSRNPADRQIFRDIQIQPDEDIANVAREVRQYLGVELEEQKKALGTVEALKLWRRQVESAGIFVFKRPFKQKREISGFCLVDDEFPVIYINNSTAKSRQIFTLIHELAHILLGASGIAKERDDFIPFLEGRSREVEIFCNKFAAEFLVPSEDFEKQLAANRPPERIAEDLANAYNVSREVILRKLLDRGLVAESLYERKAEEWTQEFFDDSGGEGGGNYYANQATYLGKTFLDLAFGRYWDGDLSTQQLSNYLNVKAKNLEKLAGFVYRG